jgi:hypothetical protein
MVAATAIGAGLAAWAIGIEPGRVRVRSVDVALPDAPQLRGLRIAAMGDIHTGAPHIDAAKLRATVEDEPRGAYFFVSDASSSRLALSRSGCTFAE